MNSFISKDLAFLYNDLSFSFTLIRSAKTGFEKKPLPSNFQANLLGYFLWLLNHCPNRVELKNDGMGAKKFRKIAWIKAKILFLFILDEKVMLNVNQLNIDLEK